MLSKKKLLVIMLGCSLVSASCTETTTEIEWVYVDASFGGDADADADTDADADGGQPWLVITSPEDGDQLDNPITFFFESSGAATVEFFADQVWPLQDSPIPAGDGELTYAFSDVNYPRDISAVGYDEAGNQVAADLITVTPVDLSCLLGPQPGFNEYTIRVINDWTMYPKDGTYPYCWNETTCGDMWGQIHDGYYGGELLFDGGGDCFCSGHTLEIFLAAYSLWLDDNDLQEGTLFEYGASTLPVSSVDIGEFYQWWQGFGVATYASSAHAFDNAGIGEVIEEDYWDEVLPGDYVNLSRSTGSGHAVIFVDWVEDAGEKVGLRYYGCNNSGASCPDPNDPENTSGNSGPSFITEYFDGEGGTVLPSYLFIGRVFLPTN